MTDKLFGVRRDGDFERFVEFDTHGKLRVWSPQLQ